MNYININTAAEKWGITVRRVQELCKNGSIEGATRFGRAWMIPEDAQKPADRRMKNSNSEAAKKIQNLKMPMPLLNTPYKLGNVMDSITKIEDEDTRNIALGEYYYFSGRSAPTAHTDCFSVVSSVVVITFVTTFVHT